MRRREFITLLGVLSSAAVAWPLAARAQQGERVRRIGVLMNLNADDPEATHRITAFLQGMQKFGWAEKRNLQIDTRWGANNADMARKHAAELVALAPDAVLAVGALSVDWLQQTSRTVPIVFVNVTDPVGAGFVASLARPGGNATGFTLFEYGISAKWLELLKQLAPSVRRAAVLRDSSLTASMSQFAAVQPVAQSIGVELTPINTRDAREIERAIAAFAVTPDSGIIVVTGASALVHRELLVALAARHKLPAVYPRRYFAKHGGLLSYGPKESDQYHRAAGYIDRILKGEKPADLPVQAPTEYELVINLKTAKALGLTVPPSLLARADEVIE